MPDPPPERVPLHHLPVHGGKTGVDVFTIPEPVATAVAVFFRVQFLDDPGRVAGDYDVGRNIVDNDRPGGDNAVVTDGNAFADHGVVADPDVFSQRNRGCATETDPVVNVMPVRIGQIGAGGEHAAVTDGDFFGGADADAGTDKAGVTDKDTFGIVFIRPDGEPDLIVGCRHDGDVVAQVNERTEDLDIPGLHEREVFAKGFKLRAQKMVYVKILKFYIEVFKIIWT